MQAECEAKTTTFPALFWCTRGAIAERNPGIFENDRAKLYLLRGQQLAEQVTAGKLSDLDARVEWQRLYVELREARDAEVTRSLAAMPRPASPVTCTTTAAGGVATTSCR
ncbi:MAG: hypothetical protein CFE45_01565 [Burkholderiales bacterium PBB5]|nr:MAG: hypothetical protein CFE45_01565 [Burkholderiales bacterium PBB5]